MKTITLTEEAYERLSVWKELTKDSFSKVIERVVPKRGTLGSVLDAVQKLSPLSSKEEKQLMDVCSSDREWKNQKDPWTT